jgi:hypothetical protein
MNARQEGCIFCHHDQRPKVAENNLALAIVMVTP